MCEKNRHCICYTPCAICSVNDCDMKDNKSIGGCAFGKPSNEVIKWAFDYVHALNCTAKPTVKENDLENI